MKIVVTGGSGRLGRSIVAGLATAGNEVVSFDVTAPTDAGVDAAASTIVVDLTDATETTAAFDRVRPDVVVHLAAIAVPFSAPEETILATNTALCYNVVTAAAAAGATRVLVASSPTVIGYGAPTGWQPAYLPIDEQHPIRPWNAYALSKAVIEQTVAMAVARDGDRVQFGVFRPCFVIAPEEWRGAPTQQGHSVADRLDHPEYGAVSLFNYVDARDVADFVLTWIDGASGLQNGDVFFVGAEDALARESLSSLLPRFLTGTDAATSLTGTSPAFSVTKARELLGWRPRRSWRTELDAETTPEPASPDRSPGRTTAS